MPDFGIGEAIAGLLGGGGDLLGGLFGGAAADAGAAGLAAGTDAALGGGLAAAGAGADAAASGGLLDLLGGGVASADAAGAPLGLAGTVGGAANPLADLGAVGLGGGGAPAASFGAAPLAAAPVDLASAAAAPTAFAQDPLAASTWLSVGGNVPTDTSALGLAAGGGASPSSVVAGGFDALTGGANAAPTGLAELAGVPAGGAAGGGGAASELAGLTGSAVTSGGEAGGAAGGGLGNSLSSLLGNVGAQVAKNPIGLAAGLGGLGYSIFEGRKTSANENALTAAAGAEAGQGAQLQSYLNNGTLPPGMQAQVDQAKAAAKAQIISGYASRGQNTDPNQNSALAQELASADMNAVALQGQLATQLLQSGLQETGMSNNLYQALIQMDQTQAQNMGKAIANFAGALAPKTSINLGGASAAA